MLAGELMADEGLYSFGHGVQPGYYAQEHEGVVPGRDLLSHMREVPRCRSHSCEPCSECSG
jgi:ATPase subunit of ABC transporter with duplicated ATPase domains